MYLPTKLLTVTLDLTTEHEPKPIQPESNFNPNPNPKNGGAEWIEELTLTSETFTG